MTSAQTQSIPNSARVTIRQATVDDLPILTEFWTALYQQQQSHGLKLHLVPDAGPIWAEQMASRLAQHSTIALLGLCDDRPAGFLSGQLKIIPPIYDARMGGIIQDVYTLPEFRRQGLARHLVQAAIRQFAERGAQSLEVQTAHLDQRSLAFWASMGWEPEVIQLRNTIAPTDSPNGPQSCSDA